jgi:xylulokinase
VPRRRRSGRLLGVEWALAVDLGTSGPKVGLVGADGRVLGGASEPTRLHLIPGGGCEQDPQDWWRAIVAAARRVTDAHPEEARGVMAVGVTAQWSGTVPVGADLRPLGRAIIWLDHRGAALVRRTIGGPVRVEGYSPRKLARWIRLTGGAPGKGGKDPIAHILWLRQAEPELYRATRVFLEPKDYLNLVLTGRAAATFDSIALHWVTDNRDPDAVRYDDRLLRLGGLESSRLPELVRATDRLGPLLPEAAQALGIPAGVPVVGGTPDIQSAGIGAGAVADFAAHLYLGTSSWLSCHLPFKKTNLFTNMASLPAPVPGRWFLANEQETAGACIDQLARTFYPGVEHSEALGEINAAAARAPAGSRGLVFTPWLNGERTPVEDSSLRGGYFNQSLDTGRDEMVRAVFEGVALNTRWLLEAVEDFAGRRMDPITVVGGGAQSALWCRIYADVLGRTVRRTQAPLLVNVRGAGLLALAALGVVGFADIPDLVLISDTLEPEAQVAGVYDQAYDTFRRIHRAGRRLYAHLNPLA